MALALNNTIAGVPGPFATQTTASFTPASGSLIVVCWMGNSTGSAVPGTPTITDSLGTHLTYTLSDWVKFGDAVPNGGINGQAAIWTAVGTGVSMTISVQNAVSAASDSALKVIVFTDTGTPTLGAHGKANSTAATTTAQNYTASATGGWGLMTWVDWDAKGAPLAGTGCTGEYLDTLTGQISFGVVARTTADDTVGVTNTLNITTGGAATSTNASWVYLEVLPNAGGGAATIPPPLRQQLATTDPGKGYYLQRDRRNANLVGTAANPLVPPLDSAWQADGRYWHLYNDIAQRFTPVPYAQKDRRDANTTGTAPPVGPPATPAFLAAEAAAYVDRRAVPQQRSYVSDPSLLTTALLENELLGGAGTAVRYQAPAAYADRREVPQQRAYVSNPSLLGTALLENELLGGADTARRYQPPAAYTDRRLVPQQRDLKSDPSLLAPPPAGALVIDGSSPAGVKNTGSPNTTASFTPPAGSLIVVCWNGNSNNATTPTAPTVTDNLGTHLTYTLIDFVEFGNSVPNASVNGQAAIWTAVGTGAAMTISVTNNNSIVRDSGLKVLVFTGNSTPRVGAHGKANSVSATAISQSYTASATGGWGVLTMTDWDIKGAPTAGTGCTSEYSDSIPGSISFGTVRRSTADDVAGASNTLNITIGGGLTSTNACWCYVEILPALIWEDASQPAAVTTNAAATITTGSFSPPAGSLLVAQYVPDSAPSTLVTGSITDSLGGTWTLLKRANLNAALIGGAAEVWCRYLSSAPGAMTVSGTNSFGATGGGQLLVRVLNGAASVQNGATASIASSSVTPTVSITPTVDGSRVYASSLFWTSATTQVANANTTRTAEFLSSHATAYDAYKGFVDAAAPLPSTTYGFTNAAGSYLMAAVEILPAAGGAVTIPPPPRQQLAAVDSGESYYLQKDRRNANLVATLANPLPAPLDVAWGAGGTYWHLYGDVADAPARTWQSLQRDLKSDPSLLGPALAGPPAPPALPAAAYADRRLVPQQRDLKSDPLLLTTALLENELLGSAGTASRYLLPATNVDRREVPQQHSYVSDPLLLTTALLENELLGGADTAKRYQLPATHVDRRLVPQQRSYVSDPLLLTTALLENELLGGATAWLYYNTPAYIDPLVRPAQRPLMSDPALTAPLVPLDPTLAGWPVGWLNANRAGTHADRRLVPQQRPYISDPSTYPTTAPTDPLTLAWGAGGTYWLLYNQPAQFVDRREVPQQRSYVSDPLLLATALLENELLGGAGTAGRYLLPATNVDRRLVPQQRAYVSNPSIFDLPLNPTLAAWPTTWLLYNQPATHVDRREVPQQRPYISDPSAYPTIAPIDPLTIAYGAGGRYWLLYNQPALTVDRRLVPQQRAYVSDPRLFTTALLENELLGNAGTAMRYQLPATHVDRRLVPQQRAYISNPLAYGNPLLENELLGGAGTAVRYLLPATHVDRRLVPQQRNYVSDPLLLITALLENELLGGAGTAMRHQPAMFVDRRLVPQQRAYVSNPLLLTAAQLENELLGSADDLRRRYQLAAMFVDRREVPQQRAYVSDPSIYPTFLPTEPLTLAYGAGGTYWHLYNQPGTWNWRRSWWPPRLLYNAICVCVIFRPGTGTTTEPTAGLTGRTTSGLTGRPGSGTTGRPGTGTTHEPCC